MITNLKIVDTVKRKRESISLGGKKGITLIALVVTIIILLILAGVTISIVMNAGILEKSQTAADRYNEEQARENLEFVLLEYKIAKITGNKDITLEGVIRENGGTLTKNEENGEYTITIEGFEFTVDGETLEIKSSKEGTETPVSGTKPETPEKPEKTEYTVTLKQGEGIEKVEGGGKVEEGKSVSISATVEEGYEFSKWEITEGVGNGTIANEDNEETTVTVTGDITIQATASIESIFVLDNTNGTANVTLTGEKPSYNNPVIPVGFGAINTNDAKWKSTDEEKVDDWDKGLVIQDEDGNEFVWVPAYIGETEVEGVQKYEKKLDWSKSFISGEVSDDSIPTKVSGTNEGKGQWNQSETSQIGTYGGFYIARYEAGIPESLSDAIKSAEKRNVSGKPISQKNAVPWNYIAYTKSKANAESMYSTNYVQSGLVTGTMWDTVMKWFKASGVDVDSDSGLWGNYMNVEIEGVTWYCAYHQMNPTGQSWNDARNSPVTKKSTTSQYSSDQWLLKTGNTEYTKRKNIYDLAGNLDEWTNEKSSTSGYVDRGGSYCNTRTYTAANRDSWSGDASAARGFRVVLYIK